MPFDRERGAAAALVVLIHLGMLWLLLSSHGRTPPQRERALASFDVVPPLPAPTPTPPPSPPISSAKLTAPAGRSGWTARRTPVTAPSPILAPPPTPLPAAIVPDVGSVAVGGAGVAGTGTGAGAGGTGQGAGGTGTGGSRARLLKGVIRSKDYPRAEREAKVEGTVTVAFIVGTDGRARDCRVQRSSGSAALDATTCRLIVERFRYAPAIDAAGRPIAEERGWQQRWWIADAPAD